jgi:hypothetical protein
MGRATEHIAHAVDCRFEVGLFHSITQPLTRFHILFGKGRTYDPGTVFPNCSELIQVIHEALGVDLCHEFHSSLIQ